MTDRPSPLDAHAYRLAAALREGDKLRRAQARRRRRATLTATPILVGACLAVALWPSTRANILARASAALTPQTNVVHFRVVTRMNSSGRGICGEDQTADDVWLETAGATRRWRWRQAERRCATIFTGFDHRTVGPTETAFDGRALITSSVQGGWVERFTNPSAAARSLPDIARLGGITRVAEPTDPVRFVQRLLAENRLRVSHQGTVDGREVFWLRGKDAQQASVRVAIEAASYVPVTVIRKLPDSDFLRKNPKLRAHGPSEERIEFEVYEPASAGDLRPKLPTIPHEVIDMDWSDAMAAMRARRRAESREGHRRALQMQRDRADARR